MCRKVRIRNSVFKKYRITYKKKRWNASIRLGENEVVIEPFTVFPKGNSLWTMGAYSYSNSELPANTIVGRYCSIAHSVIVIDGDHPLDRFTTSVISYPNPYWFFLFEKNFSEVRRPVVIGNDVWIGQNVFIKPGVEIGDGAIIGANAFIAKNVPPYAIVGGNPARLIRFRFDEETVKLLMEIKWWEYDISKIKDIDVEDVVRFINFISTNKSNLQKFNPEKLVL